MRHEPASRRFVNRTGNGQVIFKLQSECDLLTEAHIRWRAAGGTVSRQTLRRLGNVNGREYFSVTVDGAGPLEYVFHLNACGQTRWLTPHGMSPNTSEPPAWFTFDPRVHEPFATPAWVRDAVFYQIFPDRFCNGDATTDPADAQPWGSVPTFRNFMGGDLQGVLEKLGYLGELGVNAIYLTPIFESGSNHKYDTVDYFKVDPHFGDLALLRKLVDACHARGIRVVLDAVFNHCSNRHPYFLDVRAKGERSRYWDWFHIKQWPIPDRFAKHGDAREWYECWWGFASLPKLNYANQAVEEYFLKVAQYWLREAGTDGWRLDVPNEVVQTFWPKFRQAVKNVNPDAYIVGEIWEDASPWLTGDQFDAVMNYRFQKALLGYFAENKLSTTEFDYRLRELMLDYPEQATAVMLNLLGSHDTPRPMTAAKGDVESLKLMVAMQFTFEGAPCIYYGDEIGMEGGKDPDCRRCYPWDDAAQQDADLLAYYQKLIAIRKANPALRSGSFQPFLVDPERDLYVFERQTEGNHCLVALNRGVEKQTVALPAGGRFTELLPGRNVAGRRVVVPARQAVIVRRDTA
jgi:glycosidase